MQTETPFLLRASADSYSGSRAGTKPNARQGALRFYQTLGHLLPTCRTTCPGHRCLAHSDCDLRCQPLSFCNRLLALRQQAAPSLAGWCHRNRPLPQLQGKRRESENPLRATISGCPLGVWITMQSTPEGWCIRTAVR